MTIVYYRGADALITDRAFHAWSPRHRLFPVADLYAVHVVPGAADRLAVRSVGIACSSAALALAEVVLLRTMTAAIVGVLLVVVPGAVSGFCWRLGRRDWELWAMYRGFPVRLYHSRDLQTFGQVRRALLRTLEAVPQRA